MLRDILPQGGSRSDRSVQKNLMETLMEGKMILRGGDTVKDEGMHDTQCLKIKEKVSFNIASEASYAYILSGQKFIKNGKNCQFWRVFENLKLAVEQCYQTGQF